MHFSALPNILFIIFPGKICLVRQVNGALTSNGEYSKKKICTQVNLSKSSIPNEVSQQN